VKANAADFVGDYMAGGHILNLGAMLTVAFDGWGTPTEPTEESCAKQ
jgi:hypothetical protein